MRILEMADGTKYTVSLCGKYDNLACISSPEIQTFAKAVEVFSDTAKTARMVCTIIEWPDDEPQVFDGYTTLLWVQNQSGDIVVGLRKE